jgi:hypothetical protein
MDPNIAELLADSTVAEALRAAWLDSNPGPSGGHEEGGFVVRKAGGSLYVHRWPRGETEGIVVPAHAKCRFAGDPIAASFHTHPNTGAGHKQEPSDFDIAEVVTDDDLLAPHYLGEFVLSNARVYLIEKNGNVMDLGERLQLLLQEDQ